MASIISPIELKRRLRLPPVLPLEVEQSTAEHTPPSSISPHDDGILPPIIPPCIDELDSFFADCTTVAPSGTIDELPRPTNRDRSFGDIDLAPPFDQRIRVPVVVPIRGYVRVRSHGPIQGNVPSLMGGFASIANLRSFTVLDIH